MTQESLPFRPSRPNLVIEAGAGTGKTTEIVKEVVQVLLDHPSLNPDRLVMITFTEKAAAELGARVRDALTEFPSSKHLERIDRIRSQTIHAFCQGILRVFPIEAGVDPNFRLIEGYERSRLLQETYAAWLEHETVTRPTEEWLEDWETVLEHFTGVDRVREAVFQLLEKRVLITDDAYPLGDFADAEQAIRGAITEISGYSAVAIAGVPSDNGRRVLQHLHDVPPPMTDSLAEWREYFAPIAEALTEINLNHVPREMRAPLKVLRQENGMPSVHDLLVRHQAAAALRRLACRFITFLDEQKRRKGVLDFDDLLLRTAELLENDAFGDAVRARFDYIFVDEFQDTDRVQARIIDRLARNWAGELIHGRIVLVGDPKQSIYAFRHADPETYRDTLARFEAGGAVKRTLTRQYRSEPELVSSLNAMFSRLFAVADDPNVYRPSYHQLEPARSSTQPGPHIQFLRAEATSEDSEAGAAEHEGRAIASFIRDQVDRGRGFRDFAILLRKMTNVQAFLDALDRCAIPYVLPPTGALLETRPIVDLLAVLRAIAAPYDRGACVSAARSPYFALDDDEISAGVLGAESAGWKDFNTQLDRYRALATKVTVAELIERLIGETDLELVYGLTRGGTEWLRFLERFREMATQFDLTAGGSVAQFVDELLRRRDGSEETQPTPIDDGRDAVRIMTVHGSKGLEFPIVILPELGAMTKEDMLAVTAIENPPRLVFTGTVSTLASRYLKLTNDRTAGEVTAARKSAETDRLFYVAVTRAQQNVIFVCSPNRLNKRSFWKRVANLFDWPKGLPVTDSVSIDGKEVPIAFITPRPLEDEGEPSRFSTGIAEELLARPTREVSVVIEEQPSISRGELLQRAAATKNRAAGILLHRLLELWDGSSATVDPLLRELAREQGADTRAIDMTRKRLDILSRSATFRRIAGAETRGRELTIYYTGEDGSAVEARIDRLVEEDGRLVVIDFKSGRAYPTRSAADREQVERYCAAIARMTGQPCSGLLWYIDAESDEVVEVMA